MEFFVNDMKNLPEVMKRKLSDLREVDSLSSSTLKSSAADEAQLLDELAALAKADPDFDEGPITEKFNRIVARRQEALNLVDDQMKKIQKLYDLVDNRLTFIDSCTRDIAHLFPQGSVERGGSIRKKKRKKSSAEDAQSQGADDLFLEGAVAYDPNEPLYCTCRQISFGNMIACENPDCSIEWFHFACVGLKAEPDEPWFCAQCRQ